MAGLARHLAGTADRAGDHDGRRLRGGPVLSVPAAVAAALADPGSAARGDAGGRDLTLPRPGHRPRLPPGAGSGKTPGRGVLGSTATRTAPQREGTASAGAF